MDWIFVVYLKNETFVKLRVAGLLAELRLKVSASVRVETNPVCSEMSFSALEPVIGILLRGTRTRY